MVLENSQANYPFWT